MYEYVGDGGRDIVCNGILLTGAVARYTVTTVAGGGDMRRRLRNDRFAEYAL
jgi:hypothetical protein